MREKKKKKKKKREGEKEKGGEGFPEGYLDEPLDGDLFWESALIV